MFEEANTDTANSEINLNLKIPQDETDGTFSFRDLVLTVYNNRMTFLIWLCVGVALGCLAAAGLYFMRRDTSPVPVSSEVSVSMDFAFMDQGTRSRLFPDGSNFDEKTFYIADIWEKALAQIGREDVAVADAMSQVTITAQVDTDTAGFAESIPASIPAAVQQTILQDYMSTSSASISSTYIFTIEEDSTVFNDADEKESFLIAYCNEYKGYLQSRFYNDDNVGKLYRQHLGVWKEITEEIIAWDYYDFNVNFTHIKNRYLSLLEILEELQFEDPLYISAENKRFIDYITELKDIIDGDLAQWIMQVESIIYIRNADSFISAYDTAIDIKRINEQYYTDLLSSYNRSLFSYRQSLPEVAAGREESLDLFNQAQEAAVMAAELGKQINRMELQYDAMTREPAGIRNRSVQAEKALTELIVEMYDIQNKLSDVIFEYYYQSFGSDAENCAAISETNIAKMAVRAASGPNLIMVAFAFVACVGVSIVMAFFVVAVKKHLPDKSGNP